MRKPAHRRIHTPGLLKTLLEQLRGREQTLIRSPEKWPLLLVSYARGDQGVAEELEAAWLHTLPSLQAARAYLPMLEQLPTMVVILFRARNVCTCLGHHHVRGTESRLTRRLAGDIGSTVGEIDMAWETIRDWRPHPLTTLGAEAMEQAHFRIALLTVLLHELQHLACPDHNERIVRGASDDFYGEALEELANLAR